MKKIISCVCVLAMVLMMFSVSGITIATAATSSDFVYEVSNGKAVITGYSGSAETLVIPATLGGYSVVEIGEEAFKNCTKLKSVVLPDSVISIGNKAFYYCYSLVNITLSASLTSIGERAFYMCRFTDIELPTGLISIGDYAFFECNYLASVELPMGVSSIGQGVFGYCFELKSVIFSEKLTSIGKNAFESCRSLEYVTLPNSVTSIGYGAFSGCKLIEITVPSGVKNIEDYTFSGCASLVDVSLPVGVTNIGANAFSRCYSLVNIAIPSTVTSIGDDAFALCDSLVSITVDERNTAYSSLDGVLFNKNKTTLIQYPCGKTDVEYTIPISVKNIREKAFSDCDYIIDIKIPNSVTNIGDYAFLYCDSLASIKIPNSIKSIGNDVFAYCTSLAVVEIPNSVTSIGKDAFEACESLTDIKIPNSVTSIGKSAFQHCSKLKTITIPASVKSIGNEVFEYCSALTGVTIRGRIASIGEDMFVYCRALTIISIPDSVKNIGEDAFLGCNSLSYIYYEGDEEQWNAITIEAYNKPLQSANIYYNIKEKDPTVAVFSTEKSLSMEAGDDLWLGFGLIDENGALDENWKQMAVSVSDPTVVSLSDYEETEFGYALRVKGLKQGATNVVVTDTDTGANIIFQIRVYDKYAQTYSYDIENIASFYPQNKWEDQLQTNMYNLSGLYVNNYSCTKSGAEYSVSFDVYNSKYYAGAVDIYDANGLWIGYEEIEKYSDIDGLWDTVEQAWHLVSDLFAYIPGGNNSNLMTYEQESFSKHTKIEFEVPEGGYFTISNNVSASLGTFVINSLEILFEGAYTAVDLIMSDSVKTSALSGFKDSAKRSLTARLIEARNESLKNEMKKKAYEIMLGTMQSEIEDITKNFTSEQIKDNLSVTSEMSSDMMTLAENILESYNIEWKHLFQTATGVLEAGVEQFAGPAGIALKGCFAITKGSNKLLMAMQMAASSDNAYATVYSDIAEGEINPQGVVINTNGNVDAEAVLQVFRVSKDASIESVLDRDNLFERYEQFNICFVKNDQEVQPSGKVKVHVPIPQGMKSDSAVIYRQETDGSWTILDAHVEGNYLVFETDHFSMYAVVGDVETLSVTNTPTMMRYIEGEILETDGMVLQFGDAVVEDGYYCDSMMMYQVGTQRITVKYGDAETSFDVEVLERIMGDVTRDAVLDTSDVRLALYKLTGWMDDFTKKESAIADVNSDGIVDSADVRVIMLAIIGEDAS